MDFQAKFSDFTADTIILAAENELFCLLRENNLLVKIKSFFKAVLYLFCDIFSAKSLPTFEKGKIYHYCFVIDGVGANGLDTFCPLLESLSKTKSALVVVRSWVVRKDKRLLDLAMNSTNIYILYIDKTRVNFPNFKRILLNIRKTVNFLGCGYLLCMPPIIRSDRYFDILSLLYSKGHISNIITANERMLLSNISIRLAKAYSIKTYCLQHGLLVDSYLPVISDTYLTWGDIANDWFRKNNVSSKLVGIGSPRISNSVRVAQNKKKVSGFPFELIRMLRKKSEKVIVFFSQKPGVDYPAEGYFAVFDQIVKLANIDGISVVVKVHPSDNIKIYRSKYTFSSLSKIIWADQKINTYDLMEDADYICSYYSTTLVEGMLFSKPVFQLICSSHDVPDYSAKWGGIRVNQAEEMVSVVRQFEVDPKKMEDALLRQEKYLNSYFSQNKNPISSFFEQLHGSNL